MVALENSSVIPIKGDFSGNKNENPVITILIPAYNEANRIENTLHDYVSYFNGHSYEILVEMDGCTDITSDVVQSFCGQYPVRCIQFQEKLGKGAGIIQGLKHARGEIIVIVDADGAVSPKMAMKLIEFVNNGCYCAVSSRYADGAKILVTPPLARWIASRGFNMLVRLLFGLDLKDTQCGGKAFKKIVINDVVNELVTSNFAFDIELLWRIQKKGYVIKEVPITWMHKDESKVKMYRVIPEMFLSLLRLRWKG